MRDQTHLTQSLAVQSLPRDQHRTYLAVFADAEGEGVTVVISNGSPFIIQAGNSWGPMPAPMNDIAMSGIGTILFTGTRIE